MLYSSAHDTFSVILFVAAVLDLNFDEEFATCVGIADTRATHGVPSEVNSYPQRSDETSGECLMSH